MVQRFRGVPSDSPLLPCLQLTLSLFLPLHGEAVARLGDAAEGARRRLPHGAIGVLRQPRAEGVERVGVPPPSDAAHGARGVAAERRGKVLGEVVASAVAVGATQQSQDGRQRVATSLNCSWQSNKGTCSASGLAGIEPMPSESK